MNNKNNDILKRIGQAEKYKNKILEKIKTITKDNLDEVESECSEFFEEYSSKVASALDIMAGGIMHYYGKTESVYFPKDMKGKKIKETELFKHCGSNNKVQSFFIPFVQNNWKHVKPVIQFNNTAKHNKVLKAKKGNSKCVSNYQVDYYENDAGGKMINCQIHGLPHDENDLGGQKALARFFNGGKPPKKAQFHTLTFLQELVLTIKNDKNQIDYNLTELVNNSFDQINEIYKRFKIDFVD